MIGNDIVDIEFTLKNSDWTRRGFLDKIFNDHEQEIIADSSESFKTVWRLWSMKEAVYKLYVRSVNERSFYPSSIACRLLSDEKGIVTIEGRDYGTTSICCEEYIFSSTSLDVSEKVKHQVVNFETPVKKDYYSIIKDQLSVDLDWNRNQIDIIKTELGIPELYFDNIKQDVYLSITHHGKYLAFSYATLH